MTDWKLDNAYQMKKDGYYFWITLNNLEPGKEYRFQYAVERADGVKKQICDLYSEKVLHPDDKWEPKQVDPTLIDYPKRGADGGYVTVIQTNKPQYQWSEATLNFQRPNKNNLIIYELWVYDYATKRTFQGVKERLDYLQNLGVNAIELMPLVRQQTDLGPRTPGSEAHERFIEQTTNHHVIGVNKSFLNVSETLNTAVSDNLALKIHFRFNLIYLLYETERRIVNGGIGRRATYVAGAD